MKWFKTWNRPEYKEWASKIPQGYFLIIIRKEKDKYLCVSAELIVGERGLPRFKVVKEHYFGNEKEAQKQIKNWKT
ncbi:MAG: hypothetical protein HY424_01600 [Candidatus Levybacteria bacterium]|nr:hypothetical protein [Candidatus Levybacteria bacterium]